MPRSPSLDLVLIGYRLRDTRAAIRFCDELFGPRSTRRRVLVVNRHELADELAGHARGWEVLRGSNTLGEFSAWQEALDHIGEAAAVTLFVNDTVTTHRVFSRARRLALKRAVHAASGACAVGFLDRAAGVFAVDGKPLDCWVSTYCFALTAEALARLGGQLALPSVCAACVPGGTDEQTFFDRMSPDLVERLRVLLFGGGWYASQALTSQNAEFFRFKARCVVAEKHLAARCIDLGIALVDPFAARPLLVELDRLETRCVRAVAKLARELKRRRGPAAA